MALIDCPDCGGRVSNLAAACPACGFPVAAQMAAPPDGTTAARTIGGIAGLWLTTRVLAQIVIGVVVMLGFTAIMITLILAA